jgi:hypothetical protein
MKRPYISSNAKLNQALSPKMLKIGSLLNHKTFGRNGSSVHLEEGQMFGARQKPILN